MIPAELLSSWGLRRQLEERHGVYVTERQLDSYVRWGLLPNPAGRGGWAAEAVDLVRAIHLVAKRHPRLRPLPRRVVYLRGNYLRFPVPETKVLDAMVAMIPSVEASYRKIRRIWATMQRWARYMASQGRVRENPDVRREWRPPKRQEWQKLLTDSSGKPGDVSLRQVIERRLAGQYHWDAVMRTLGDSIGYDLNDIPLEERLLILTVLDAALIREARHNYELMSKSAQQTPEAAVNDLGGNRTREVPPHASQPYRRARTLRNPAQAAASPAR